MPAGASRPSNRAFNDSTAFVETMILRTSTGRPATKRTAAAGTSRSSGKRASSSKNFNSTPKPRRVEPDLLPITGPIDLQHRPRLNQLLPRPVNVHPRTAGPVPCNLLEAATLHSGTDPGVQGLPGRRRRPLRFGAEAGEPRAPQRSFRPWPRGQAHLHWRDDQVSVPQWHGRRRC